MKIYTKKGDSGETSFFDGKRVFKDHLRIEAYGTIDELNAFLGSLIQVVNESLLKEQLTKIQNDLFTVGSQLAANNEPYPSLPMLKEERLSDLEKDMDNMDESLEPLKNFILPGGNERIVRAHICRVVSRRAERRVVTLSLEEKVDSILLSYMNRLSDYFFILARYLAKLDSTDEVIWKP